ncbi:MAG: glycoside hydrolase family 5 protein [Armatimonadota bacterium]
MPSPQDSRTSRREFIRAAAVGGLALASALSESDTQEAQRVTRERLAQWHGFNLLEKFTLGRNAPFVERDFQWMADWGFTFARLPMDYRCWSDADDPMQLKEPVLKEIDQAVELGKQYGVHIDINFHRAPGYSVNRTPPEQMDLWTEERPQEICEFHWRHFARRYKGIPNQQVSFNLFNEPGRVDPAVHDRVVRRMITAIREEDPDRLIILDGLWWANNVIPGVEDLGVAQSTRGYQPMDVSHYKASWVGGENWPKPSWPGKMRDGKQWDKETLRERFAPWAEKAKTDPGVHVGEFGAFRFTPHEVVLGWMKDWLDIWAEARVGCALWNLRGSFGVVDSEREDVEYEKFDGDHQLDRKMLELLRQNAAAAPD